MMQHPSLTYDQMDTPIGTLTLIASPNGLHAILLHGERPSDIVKSDTEPTLTETKRQLLEYFHGKRTTFDLPLVLNGTPFQLQAWRQLQQIPYGSTISYAEQASRIGDKKKARAIGLANGRNPIPIIIPCHRVIGSDGRLGGFSGGLEKKVHLLQLERNVHRSS